MKKTLLALMLLPCMVQAQEADLNSLPAVAVNEITVNTGLNFQPRVDFKGMDNGDTRFTLGYMHNIDKLQIGVRVEAGSDFFWYNYISPVLLVNKKFTFKRSYLYAGAAAGYYERKEGLFEHAPVLHLRGYTLGLQGGASLYLSEHFSFTSELAVRSTQFWYKTNYYYPKQPYNPNTEYYHIRNIENDFSISFPVTIGITYKF